MIASLIARINRLRLYLCEKELLPDEKGSTWIETARDSGGDPQSFEITGMGAAVNYRHTWSISHHNGDYFDHQIIPITDQELTKELEKIDKQYRSRAEMKVKYQLETEAIRKRMAELDLLP
jgi:hypothetical protein